ncbi:MAG: hypothetical protein RLO21_06270 [Nitratireductor sp.]
MGLTLTARIEAVRPLWAALALLTVFWSSSYILFEVTSLDADFTNSNPYGFFEWPCEDAGNDPMCDTSSVPVSYERDVIIENLIWYDWIPFASIFAAGVLCGMRLVFLIPVAFAHLVVRIYVIYVWEQSFHIENMSAVRPDFSGRQHFGVMSNALFITTTLLCVGAWWYLARKGRQRTS